MTPVPSAALNAPAAPPQPWWRRLLPFAIGLGLIAFVFGRLDLRTFVAHLRTVNVPAIVLFGVAFVLALLTADSFATVIIYRRSVAPIRFRDFWVLRGASYLPSMLNHHVGQAFVTYFLSRTYGVSLLRVAGATLLVYASWMGCLLIIGSVAIVLNKGDVLWVVAVLGVGVLYLIVLALRPAALSRTKLLAPLFEAGVSGHLLALVVRLPHFVVLFLGTWLPFRFFAIDIPPGAAAAYVPIIMVAVTLPITPQGIGTRDTASAFFFEKFAPGGTHDERLAAIAAATLSWGVVFTVVEALLGILLLRRAMPQIEPPRELDTRVEVKL